MSFPTVTIGLQTRLESPPKLDSSLGAIVVGAALALCLYGAMCVQVFCYYQHNFKKDPVWIKFLVFWCTLVETVHTALVMIYVYECTVTHFGDYNYLVQAHWALAYSVATSTLISTPVQVFYAFRVYTLSKKWWYLLFCGLASLLRIGLTFADAVLSEKVGNLVVFQTIYKAPIIAALAVGFSVDVINTSCLVFLLLRNKEDALGDSRHVIDKLVMWTVETGLLTSLANFTGFLLVLTIPSEATWLCPALFTAKLFSNSLLASLNGRVSLRATSSSVHTSTNNFSPPYKTEDSSIRFRSNSNKDGVVLRTFRVEDTSNDYDASGAHESHGQDLDGHVNSGIYKGDLEASLQPIV